MHGIKCRARRLSHAGIAADNNCVACIVGRDDGLSKYAAELREQFVRLGLCDGVFILPVCTHGLDKAQLFYIARNRRLSGIKAAVFELLKKLVLG